MSGWLKAHRSLADWEWYKDGNTFRLFFHLLIRANFSPSRFMGVSVPAGSLATGRKSLSSELAMSEDKIRTALEHLKSTGEITQQVFSKFSIITIVKWKDYQDDPHQIPTKSPPNPHQIPTSIESKKEIKEEVCRMPFKDFPDEWRVWTIGKTSLNYERTADEWATFKEYWTIGKGKNTKRANWFLSWKKWCEKYRKDEKKRKAPDLC